MIGFYDYTVILTYLSILSGTALSDRLLIIALVVRYTTN